MMRRLWWIAPGALVLAWLVMLAPSSAAMAGLLFDAQLLLAWPDTPRGDVAVVEIDDASVRALQTQAGALAVRAGHPRGAG
jgi:CHASE2 domain-containing sensor protein